MVERQVSLVGSVVLRGIRTGTDVQLLEGSHRMAYAIEQGVPVHIVLFGEDEVIPHDCDCDSDATGLPDRATAGELARQLLTERGLYHQAVYESGEHANVHVVDGGGNGRAAHARLLQERGSPFCAFPEKVWAILFGETDVYEKQVLVLGGEAQATALARLGARVTFREGTQFEGLKEGQFDLLYALGMSCRSNDLCGLMNNYQCLLKSKGLLVILDAHPFANAQKQQRRYDDLRPQPDGKIYWRFSDFTRWIPAAGLKPYAYIEVQGEDALPEWLACFAHK